MKSYFLGPASASHAGTVAALSATFPGQSEPWLLREGASDSDVIAYFHLVTGEAPGGDVEIQADISGRHYHRDAEIVAVLEGLRPLVGGEITADT